MLVRDQPVVNRSSCTIEHGQFWINIDWLDKLCQTTYVGLGDYVWVRGLGNGRPELYEVAGCDPKTEKWWLLKVDWLSEGEKQLLWQMRTEKVAA